MNQRAIEVYNNRGKNFTTPKLKLDWITKGIVASNIAAVILFRNTNNYILRFRCIADLECQIGQAPAYSFSLTRKESQ